MPTNDPTAPLFEDALERELENLLRIIVRESDALMNALPLALSRQWEASPTPQADSPTRRSAGTLDDPTAKVALDERRLEVSQAIKRAAHTIRTSAAHLAAARTALEATVSRYDGAGR